MQSSWPPPKWISVMSTEQQLPRIVAIVTHIHLPDGPSRMAGIIQQVAPDYYRRAHVEVVETTVAQLIATGRELESREDVDVIICAAATADYLGRHISTPILAIRMGEYDLIRALDRLQARTIKIGLVSFQKDHPELNAMVSLFTVDIVQATYSTFDEARLQVKRLADDGYRVIADSSVIVELAEEAGIQGVPALNGDAVRRAIEDALAVCRSKSQALIQQQRLSAVLRNLTDGVIAVDAFGLVQSLNPRMASLLGISAEWARDRPIAEVLPGLDLSGALSGGEGEDNRIIQAGGKTLAATVTLIIESGKPDGLVISCQETNAIQQADRRIRTQARSRQFTARYHFDQILGESPVFRGMLDLAQRYAQTDSTVLITGESGTGKELLAQSLHNASSRESGPFVAINCAALPESLLESELFGYKEGAFTGSRKGGKTGLIEAAHTGSLFLDEIGDMPVSLQTRLLRVLQEREVLRLGASEPTPVDIRVIAATHCDLRARIGDGRFREDLYYRLNILRLVAPPLRERAADIPALASAILQRLQRPTASLGLGEQRLKRLMPYLLRYRWPGNIRELENIVERAALSAEGLSGQDPDDALQTLIPELFEGEGLQVRPTDGQPPKASLRSYGKSRETEHVKQVLEDCHGDLEETARRLGISRTTLWRRLRAVHAS